jgi:phosphatidylglycerol---prolipoprotein diacylglyceryl transferase
MIHLIFDVLAAICSFSISALVYWWRLEKAGDRVAAAGLGYPLALFSGAIVGAYTAGTVNLWLSGQPGFGRSIVGALAGGITAIEIYKWRNGLRGSTGLVFVPAFAMSIMVGRIGCFMAGLEDYTYGTPTTVLWGVDFGDGIRRHPVQIYESLAMAAFLVTALVFWYASQRFVWEFLKPYGSLIGAMNIFHVICAGLMVYAAWMIMKFDQRGTEYG